MTHLSRSYHKDKLDMKELMRKCWANQRARGAVPSPLHAAVSLGREQPRGYIIGWALTRRRILAQIAKHHDLADWEIVIFTDSGEATEDT